MNKAQAAAVLLFGASLGVGGKQAVEGLMSKAVAAPVAPFAHAVDFRRDTHDSVVRVMVYGSRSLDAGVKDLGLSKSCAPKAATLKQAAACMDAVASDCEW